MARVCPRTVRMLGNLPMARVCPRTVRMLGNHGDTRTLREASSLCHVGDRDARKVGDRLRCGGVWRGARGCGNSPGAAAARPPRLRAREAHGESGRHRRGQEHQPVAQHAWPRAAHGDWCLGRPGVNADPNGVASLHGRQRRTLPRAAAEHQPQPAHHQADRGCRGGWRDIRVRHGLRAGRRGRRHGHCAPGRRAPVQAARHRGLRWRARQVVQADQSGRAGAQQPRERVGLLRAGSFRWDSNRSLLHVLTRLSLRAHSRSLPRPPSP
eukprot:2233384-Prymnesium_polylepis.1